MCGNILLWYDYEYRYRDQDIGGDLQTTEVGVLPPPSLSFRENVNKTPPVPFPTSHVSVENQDAFHKT